MLDCLTATGNASLRGRTVWAEDLRIAYRFAYARRRGAGRAGPDGRSPGDFREGLGAAYRAASGSDIAVELIGFGGGLDAQHDRQQLAAAPERVQRLGLVA